jgi:type I restriction enzyme S subunit
MSGFGVSTLTTVPLGSVLKNVQPGFASGVQNSSGHGIPHIRPMNVSRDGLIDRTVLKYVASDAGRPDQRLRQGDIVFNNTNSPELVGKTALFLDSDAPAFSNHMTRLRVDTEVMDSEYVAQRLHQAWRQGYFAERCNNHVSQASIGRDVLSGFPIEVAPLDAQRDMARLYRQVDQRRRHSVQHLASGHRAAERFRQSLVSRACLGGLTGSWRALHQTNETNPPEGTSPDPVVQKARSALRHDDLPAIPSTWHWSTLPQLGKFGRGRSQHRPRNDPRLFGGPYPFVQTGDVARASGVVTEYSQTYNDVGLAQSELWPEGTVCITIAANIAASALLGLPACFPDSVVGLVADPEVAVPEYIEYFMRTARHDLAAFAPATAQANINLAILSQVAVPLPPLAEQQEIVNVVEELFAKIDHIETRISSAENELTSLTRALHESVFRVDREAAHLEAGVR